MTFLDTVFLICYIPFVLLLIAILLFKYDKRIAAAIIFHVFIVALLTLPATVGTLGRNYLHLDVSPLRDMMAKHEHGTEWENSEIPLSEVPEYIRGEYTMFLPNLETEEISLNSFIVIGEDYLLYHDYTSSTEKYTKVTCVLHEVEDKNNTSCEYYRMVLKGDETHYFYFTYTEDGTIAICDDNVTQAYAGVKTDNVQ